MIIKIITDLPFKVDESSIIIIKRVPVLQCGNCSEFIIEDSVMEKVEQIMNGIDKAAELEILT